MKVWHISDTHGFHDQLVIPENIDLIIHSGDCSNYRDPIKNEPEVWKFIEWYTKIPVPLKIYVPGNHDTSIANFMVKESDFTNKNIIFLNGTDIILNDIKFTGIPQTPLFGDWAFMVARNKIYRVWDQIPDDTDVLISHGPPKSILDLTEDRNGKLEQVGCSALFKKIQKLENLKYILFGHIHDCKETINFGLRYYNGRMYSNASSVMDGRFENGIVNKGNLIEIIK